MRGLRSTIALVVVLAGLGAYIYFVTWKKPEGDGDTGKKREGVRRRSRPTRSRRSRISAAGGDATTLKKDNGTWQVAAAGRRQGRRDRSVRHHVGARDDRDRRASSTRTRRTSTTTASRTRGSRSTSRRPATRTTEAAHRREIADRRRPLREAERREAGVPDPGVPGNDVQQVHVRPARQDRAEVRPRQGRRRRSRSPAARRSCWRRTARTGRSGSRSRRGPTSDPSKG